MRLRTGTISVVPSKLSQNPIHRYPENYQEISFVIIYEKNKHLLSSEGNFPMQREQTAQFVQSPRDMHLLAQVVILQFVIFCAFIWIMSIPKKTWNSGPTPQRQKIVESTKSVRHPIRFRF